MDINYLQNQQDAEGKLFRKIAEQGHYAGRTKPTNTRQGLYIATVDGKLLASVNTTRPDQALEMIDKAIKRMEKDSGSAVVAKLETKNAPDKRYNVAFPDGGLILRQTTRDLPRAKDPEFETWRHNFDHAWLTAEELQSVVPQTPEVGQTYKISEAFAKRFARFHFVDQVKGEADAFGRTAVVHAEMMGEVVSVNEAQIEIRLKGKAKCAQPSTGNKNPYSGNRIKEERGIDVAIRGRLTYQRSTKTFTRFDVIAFGDRWGAATYNFRSRDLGPAPIGFAFEMLPTKPENMTRPKFLMWDYFETR